MPEILAVRDIVKRYGGTLALDGVSMDIRSHAVNVLIGENGAGKSTLMRILAGIEKPDSGSLLMDGSSVRFGSVVDAADRGIGIVHQELNLCPNLSVTDNVFLGRRSTGADAVIVDRTGERAKTLALLRRLNLDIDPDTPVEDLRIGQQQLVEIAKALRDDCRVLIMDEPTSALSLSEVETLFDVIGELRRSGVAIVYISHKLEELLRIGDFITVLRDGRVVGSAPAAEVNLNWIVERMLGSTGAVACRPRREITGRDILRLEHIGIRRGASHAEIQDLSLGFRAGEIVAIYGLLGAGRTEVLETICGLVPLNRGNILLDGVSLGRSSVAERIAAGIFLVPEDRRSAGLFENLSIAGNLSLSMLSRVSQLGIIAAGSETDAVRAMIQRLKVKAQSPNLPIDSLSGGNQQKVMIGRALMTEPKVLLLDEPSRGVDVGARAEIFNIMQQLAQDGLTVIFSTSDLAEARMVADRILVMSNGSLTLDARAQDVDDNALVRAANSNRVPERV
jgi:erythritol transport system ATP-binding protein